MAPARTVASVLSEPQKRLIAVAIIGGGSLALVQVRQILKSARKEQDALSVEVAQGGGKGKGKSRQTLTDKKFAGRLLRILSICVPSLWSWEALCILLQGGLLVSRTMLTEVVSSLEGTVGRHIMNADWPGFTNATLHFAACGIPAAVVNAGLKLMQKQIQLGLSNRLTRHLHDKYCDNRAFYAASVLGGLTNADQRITEDVDNFCFAVSELYSYTFKPLLDVVLFTRTLSKTMGYKAQFGLYAYYICAGALLRHTAPPLARMVAQESALTGAFRAAHQRLVTSAEEVAFNDPPAGATEKMILNQHHRRLTRYLQLSSLQRFVQAVNDQYMIKYMASVMSLTLYALFQYFSPDYATLPIADRTERYIKTVRLMGNTARGIGDLMMVYKRVAGLAGHTSRVSDLLEAVDRLASESHHECFNRKHGASALDVPTQALQAAGHPEGNGEAAAIAPKQVAGPVVSFEGVAVDSPDGTPLVRNLTFSVPPGSSVIVMGPNGSGKSSLFRCLAGLWPHQAGIVTKPPKGSTIYLAQKPYLVSGSLRDQLLYPFPPREVWTAVGPAERNSFPANPELPSAELDSRLQECLEEVEIGYLLARQEQGWDQIRNWQEILSGGEKQRLAMARLLYHRPQYAILDECTSAVSADGEVKLYQAVKNAGITALSIAHRPQLRRFHSTAIVFEGLSDANPNGWHREELNHDGGPVY